MPVIFVHGVNTRQGPAYKAGVRLKTSFIQKYLTGARINGKTLGNSRDISFPYWGDLATSFAWNMASLPHADMQSLGGPVEPDFRLLLAIIRDALPNGLADEPLLALAKKNFSNAVELIGAMALDNTPDGAETEVADFVNAGQAYAIANASPAWLATTSTDQQFLANLRLAVGNFASQQQIAVQAQGLDDVINVLSGAAAKLKEAADSMIGAAADKVGRFASTALLSWTRDSLNAQLGRFFGDVFIYFDGRGDKNNPGAIPKPILAEFSGAATRAGGEPLIVVGHSLGGVISFDLFGHFCPDLEIDLFVSVGSQVGHFEEIKLFKTSDKNIRAPQKATTPSNIKHWINVFDPVDIFSYTVSHIFDRVDVDAPYDTETYVVRAHGAYFEQARFYERLRARIDEIG